MSHCSRASSRAVRMASSRSGTNGIDPGLRPPLVQHGRKDGGVEFYHVAGPGVCGGRNHLVSGGDDTHHRVWPAPPPPAPRQPAWPRWRQERSQYGRPESSPRHRYPLRSGGRAAQGAAAWRMTACPSAKTTSSTMMTASCPSGRGSPVSTTAYCSGARETGVVSLAPKVSAAVTAMPSMAQAG